MWLLRPLMLHSVAVHPLEHEKYYTPPFSSFLASFVKFSSLSSSLIIIYSLIFPFFFSVVLNVSHFHFYPLFSYHFSLLLPLLLPQCICMLSRPSSSLPLFYQKHFALGTPDFSKYCHWWLPAVSFLLFILSEQTEVVERQPSSSLASLPVTCEAFPNRPLTKFLYQISETSTLRGGVFLFLYNFMCK